MSETKTYERFLLGQRIEHILLILSFMTLVITGLPQKYVGSGWAEGMIAIMGGVNIVRIIHRIAATIFILQTVYHLVVAMYKLYVLRVRATMMPGIKDVKDGIQTFGYNLGLAKSRPKMDRYTFDEKVEYWAMLWGSVVMIITGFMLWNPITIARILPGQFIPAAKSAHGNEALLAFLAILIWHIYNVHIRTFNKSIFTGKLTHEEMLHEHPLELEHIESGTASARVHGREVQRRRRLFIPIAAVASLITLAALIRFVTLEETAITTVLPGSTAVVFDPQTPTPLPTFIPSPTPAPTQPGQETVIAWEGSIGPIFQNRCGACHGSLGNYSVENYDSTLRGGTQGVAIVPGDVDGSPLVRLQEAGGHPGQFSAEELELVVEWIEAGAPER